jgi:hypothetical protein
MRPLTPGDRERRSTFVRQWRLLIELRQGPRTMQQLAEALDVHPRTVRRDIYALQRVPLPITSRFTTATRQGIRVVDHNLWSLGEMAEWPRREAFPTGAIGGQEAHP